uniref:Uncharacterized protein n=1 Tax=Lactuca sativa TaxID=4236 RepID=A0A9R1XRN2_LACSA|nr:hypothetical protein LSAT_V11C300135420 [Lactuca sativa]
MARLQNRLVCAAMFRQSCFGDSVHKPTTVECHLLLCHYLMCKDATTFDPVDLEELLFPDSIFLVTDLRFGDYFHPSSDFAAFIERVFPFVSLSCFVSMDDLTNVFNTSLH